MSRNTFIVIIICLVGISIILIASLGTALLKSELSTNQYTELNQLANQYPYIKPKIQELLDNDGFITLEELIDIKKEVSRGLIRNTLEENEENYE